MKLSHKVNTFFMHVSVYFLPSNPSLVARIWKAMKSCPLEKLWVNTSSLNEYPRYMEIHRCHSKADLLFEYWEELNWRCYSKCDCDGLSKLQRSVSSWYLQKCTSLQCHSWSKQHKDQCSMQWLVILNFFTYILSASLFRVSRTFPASCERWWWLQSIPVFPLMLVASMLRDWYIVQAICIKTILLSAIFIKSSQSASRGRLYLPHNKSVFISLMLNYCHTFSNKIQEGRIVWNGDEWHDCARTLVPRWTNEKLFRVAIVSCSHMRAI